MSLSSAIAAERSGELTGAARLYEEAIAAGDGSLDAFLNLAILYWQMTDVGLSSANKLDGEVLALAWRRSRELLAEAKRKFPESTEVQFWKKYIEWADLGETFTTEECKELLRRDPTTLVPVVYLLAQTRGTEYRDEALSLLSQWEQLATARSRYVVSVLKSSLRSTRRR